MRIAVIGAGAMGALYGGCLSRTNDVLLVDTNPAQVDAINRGLVIHEPDGTSGTCFPKAVLSPEGEAPVDLIVLFVKAMFSRSALENCRCLISPDTFVMTLQNGSGHEETLLDFVDADHAVIGTTQHNSAVLAPGEIRHGGSGKTCIGSVGGGISLEPIAAAFNACGLETVLAPDISRLIWDKLFTNVSASVLTGVLQKPLGFIAENPHAWSLCERLIEEAAAVAAGEGLVFDVQEKKQQVRAVCERSPGGITSICADIRDGRKTEVDTISGSVVRAARKTGVPAPTHEAMVALVHAMEG